MITGTRRKVVEVLLEGEASATDVAEELDVSLQTVHRHLTSLREDGYVRESGTRSGKTRPFKLYSVEESARVFALSGGELVERSFDVTDAHQTLLSILRVPQAEFHAPLVSHLFGLSSEWRTREIRAIAVYGPVARGEATEETAIDLLFVTEGDDVFSESAPVGTPIEEFGDGELVSNEVLTVRELEGSLELDSPFLRTVFEEMILLYDPDGFLRERRARYLGREDER